MVTNNGGDDKNLLLHLPNLPEDYLDVVYVDDLTGDVGIAQLYPFAETEPRKEVILNALKLTNTDDVKETYSIEVTTNFPYKPGDTIGIIPENSDEDLEKLFTQLKITEVVHKNCKVQPKVTAKKNLAKQLFLNQTTTLHYIFKHCLDIRCLPKKVLLRVLAEHTSAVEEKRTLQRLCSKEGAQDYIEKILNAKSMFLEILLQFPSCCPPVSRLLEQLPRMLPRPYSIASSSLSDPQRMRIVFSVVKFNNEVFKEGLCTGMLKNLTMQKSRKVNVYLRKSLGFNLPEGETTPVIMVGPGTGVAPFLGFLEERKKKHSTSKAYLFYGCKHKDKDYLFQKELAEYLEDGTLTKLFVAFSRLEGSVARYVQDNIKISSKELGDMLYQENAVIYVCGDAKNMKKDIFEAFVGVVEAYKGLTASEAVAEMKAFQEAKKYIEDVWI